MHVAVVVKLVPDVVEELVLAKEGNRLDRAELALRMNEFDEQALEQALLLKEAAGATLTVIAAQTGDVDELLYTAIAKGADRAIRLTGDGLEEGIANAQYADLVAPVVAEIGADVVLCGVQANDDLDGQLATWIATRLDCRFATVVSDVRADGDAVQVRKEFSGGLSAELRLALPVVLGVQAAPKPPRYAPMSRIRQVMKSQALEDRPVTVGGAPPPVVSLEVPASQGHAEMVAGGLDDKVARLVAILAERGLV